MAAVQIQSVRYNHEQMINWLIVNPDRPLSECAAFFNVTQPWLSTIIHSDMFQAAYRERCKEAGAVAVHTINSRLRGLAAVVLDRLQEKVSDPHATGEFILETSESVLKNLGYGTQHLTNGNGNGNGTNLHIHVDAQTLQAARTRAAARFGLVPPSGVPTLPSEEPEPLPLPGPDPQVPVSGREPESGPLDIIEAAYEQLG